MKKLTRTKKNVIIAAFDNLVNIGTSFITRKFFIQVLGLEILGINGLFGNIISMLSIAELGFSSAVIYNMYRPVVNNDTKKIKSILEYYKRVYRIIGVVVLALGLTIVPFLNNIVTNYSGNINIYIAFLLILADTVFSYYLSYRRSLLYATKNNDIININHSINIIFMNVFLIASLFVTKSFYLYLLLRLLFRIIENVILHIIAGRKYPYIKEKNAAPLDKNVKEDITKKIKALLVHKIGSFIVLGTDNIIISTFLGVIEVGLYSNYYAIISAVHGLIHHALTAITPSVGHILVKNDVEKNYSFFKQVVRYNFIISIIASACIYLLITPFVKVWLGDDYILSNLTVLVLVANFFQASMRTSFSVFKEAAGVFYEDRFVPLVESVVNILASIILVQLFGLPGVFMGTIISSLVLWFFDYPVFVYKKVLKQSYAKYFTRILKYMISFILVATIITFINMNF